MANKRVLDPCCGRDVREKLAEIVGTALDGTLLNITDSVVDCVVDALIANCVTVQEWISVKDRLPQQDEPVGLICEQVQVILSDGFVTTGWCNRSHKAWYYLPYGDTHFIGDSYENTPVIAWQPLAQPPKGE